MSARSLPVTLAPRARRDLDNILLYTLQQWGVEQEAVYAEMLRRALLAIGDNPEIG
jgi:plasmid stabilization system protein ParE